MGEPVPIIEELLQKHKHIIGADYIGYHNHVYRVYHNCLLIDQNGNNSEKYAIAAVFHDIGIWTHHTLDYLEPSIAQANIYLTGTDRQYLLAEVLLMIHWHHKVKQYKGPYHYVVNTFRKADWIDVSLGIISFGISRKTIRLHRNLLPNKGFHFMLLKKLVINLFKHPLNPLPMFRI